MKPSGDHISQDRRGGDMTANPGTPNGRSRDSPEPVNKPARHRRCQRAALPPQTHHEASISAGLGQGDQPTKTALPGEAGNSILRCQQWAQIVADCSSVPRPGWFKTQTKGKKEQSIRDQARLNRRGLPDLEKSQAPKTRKRREGQALPGRPQVPVSAVAGITIAPVL